MSWPGPAVEERSSADDAAHRPPDPCSAPKKTGERLHFSCAIPRSPTPNDLKVTRLNFFCNPVSEMCWLDKMLTAKTSSEGILKKTIDLRSSKCSLLNFLEMDGWVDQYWVRVWPRLGLSPWGCRRRRARRTTWCLLKWPQKEEEEEEGAACVLVNASIFFHASV